MKKNSLYTVTPWNQNVFCRGGNKYAFGDFQKPKINGVKNKGYMGNWLGTNKLSAGTGAMIGALGTAVGGLGSSLIGGGYDAYGVGNSVSSIGNTIGSAVSQVNPLVGGIISAGTGIIGGGINRLWGMKTNQEALNRANSDIASMKNFTSNANSFDNIEGPAAVASVGNVYKGGVFKKGTARRKNQALQTDLNNAVAFANNSVANNIENLQADQFNNLLANYAAFGGYFDMPQATGALGIMRDDKYIGAINNRSNAIAKANAFSQAPTSFSPLGNAFALGGDVDNTWTLQDESNYNEWRKTLPSNLSTETNDYNLRSAYKAGLQPSLEKDGKYHLGSRDPRTGKILKKPFHPTYLMALVNDAAMGYYPTIDAKGNTYTETWEGNKHADGGGIHIKPSHKGLFTEKANRAGMGIQAYASHVLANKEDYPSSTVKQANFAKNAAGWKHDAGGSLEAAFLDNFSSDPLGAVMQYNRSLETMEAQREAEAAAVAQQAAYDDMQKRMIDAETERQSLQSMLDSQGLTIQALMEQQRQNNYADGWKERMGDAVDNTVTSTSSLVGNAADKNKNWQYIKKKLKASGKFNDTQIEGIKLNLQRESGFNWKDRSGDSGKAWGLAQWHEPRRPKDMSFDGQINHLIDTLYNYDGKNHWIGKDNYNGFMNARTPEEAHYFIAKGWERPASEILTGLKEASDRSLRKHAFGGELGTNGTDFTTGLLEINTGNSHEENPHEGVQLGFDEQGIPNLVEEGETVYNDYVFSNRLKVPAFMRRQLGLGGSMKDDITFAAASKKIAEAGKERPNNPMDMDYMDDALGKLAQVQEAERMRMHAEETNDEMERINAMPMEGMMQGAMGLQAANGGRLNKFDKGGNTINPYAYDRSWDGFKYFNPETGKYDADYLNFVNNINQDWVNRIMRGQYGSMDRYLARNSGVTPTIAQVQSLASDKMYSDMHKAMAAAYEDYLKGIDPVTGEATLPEVEVAASNRSTNNYPQTYWGPGVDNTSFWTAAQQAGYTGLPEVDWRGNAGAKVPVYVPEGATAESIGVQAPMEVPSVLEERRKDPNDPMNAGVKGNNDERKPYATWMRYAPAVGTGIMTLTDLLGLTNRPDYTYADKLEAAANRAGYAPSIRYTPIGDYMTYRPLDRLFYANQLQANARATDRALANTSGGNRGTAQAAMIANGYNTNNNLGNLYRQAEEYNLAQREKVADFNRRTNMFNSQMGLEADMANARYRQQAANAQLSGLAQAAAMRDSIDQRVGAARSANITNLLNNLGNIGRENFAMNQINYDRTRPYKGRLNGTSYYYNENAFGGEIERNKKNKKQGRRSK